jgi:hypothetical protein
MRKAAIIISSVLMVLFAGGFKVNAQPSKESLIQVWEEIQKSDPETVVFEKIEDNRYKFKTNRFPFDGELKILNVIIDDRFSNSEFGLQTGVVEYDLVGLSDETIKKYQRSYSLWQGNNTLYYDKETNAWVSLKQYQSKMLAKSRDETQPEEYAGGAARRRNFWWDILLSWLPILLIIVLWIWLFKKMGMNRNREHMDRAKLHMNRVEDLLERIAKSIEKEAAPKKSDE